MVGAYRTTGFGFEMEVIWAQLFMSLISTAPFCLLVTAGLPWVRKLALLSVVTFAGIAFSHIHAAVQEAAVLRRYGEHPASRVVVQRWFPYSRTTVSYEPPIGAWLGDD